MQKFILYLQKQIKDEYADDKKYRRVRDHCHYTGKYSGAAYSICNLRFIIAK